jgi:two-component system NtrC family sensor kinase
MRKEPQIDAQLRDLIEIIHFTENVSTKIHGVLDKAKIYRIVRDEFARSKRYSASILLLTPNGSSLSIAEASMSPERQKKAEELAGLRLGEYEIALEKSSIFGKVVKEGVTIQARASEIYSELFPRTLARLISRLVGYGEHRPAILTPLKRHGKVIGVLALSSTQLAEHFIPSVRTLAQHISSALELADENAERKRVERQIKRRSEELAVLNTIATAVAGSLDLNAIMERALDKVLELMGLDAGTIRVLDAETGEIELIVHRGLSDQYLQALETLRPGRASIESLVASGKLVLTNGPAEDPHTQHVRQLLEIEGLHSLAVVPLKSKQQFIGMLIVLGHQSRDFTPQDVELLDSIGSQIGMAIENANLYGEEMKRVFEMEALRQTTLDITRQLDVPHLLDSIVERAAALVRTKGGGLYLYHPEDEELELVVSHYLDKDRTGTRLRVGEGLSGQVALTGHPLIVEDYATWEGRAIRYDGAPFRAVMAVPLKWGDKIIGVLNVTDLERPRSFTESDLRLLELFANQAAIAIENARLHDETARRLEELSALGEIVDELSSTLDFQRVIELVLDKAIEATAAPAGLIAVLNAERTGILLLVQRGYPAVTNEYRERPWSIDRGIVGRVVRTGELSLVDDVGQDSHYAHVIPETKSQLTVPIVRENEVAGAIVLESPRLGGFTEGQASFVQQLAEHAAVAMSNAQLYERMRESETRYRTYVENVPDAIWETDADGRFTYWSPQIENLSGYAAEELLGHTAYEFLIHPDDVKQFRNTTRRMVRDGREEYTSRHRALHRDGSTLHLELSIKTVRDEAGEVIKYRGVARDVTERVQLQAQLIQSAKLSGIGQMISGVAHELNNPLTTVMGYSQLLQAADVDDAIKEDLRRIYNDALRAQRIVQNLLTFARQKKPHRGPVDINEVIEQALSLRRYELRVDNVEVVAELSQKLPWTMADSYQLQQVFLNIINNAHQAMSQQGGGGTLTIKSQLIDNNTIRITWADTGPGMAPDVLERVFDPFFTTKEVGAGTGLGLSVSHGIIQEHGGRIWAESEEGHGATFIMELPVKSWVEDASTYERGEDTKAIPSGQHRILVIDDEQNIVDLIVQLLRDSGHESDGVTNAELALRLLREREYDLIISDVKMPRMDGAACEKEVRAIDPALAERIIFITGDLLSATTQAFLEAEGRKCLEKPFDAEALRTVVQEALG